MTVMKQTIEIEVPQGYEAKYDSTTNKVEIVKKDSKPRSWKEFCENYPIKKGEGGIRPESRIFKMEVSASRDIDRDKNFCTSVEEAEAFLALMQLRQLRKAWVKEWEPDWEYGNSENKSCIIVINNELQIDYRCNIQSPLSFPTAKMAHEFLECFGDLIEKVKILL